MREEKILEKQVLDEQGTRSFAIEAVNNFNPKDIVLLYGKLGSGKTFLVKEFVNLLGLKNEVSSPSFALVNQYSGNVLINHIVFTAIMDLGRSYDSLKKLVMTLFYHFPSNIALCFQRRNILFHVAAIVLSLAIVLSGFDWAYFGFFRDHLYLQMLFFPAVVLGGLLPILYPAILWSPHPHALLPCWQPGVQLLPAP